MNAATSVLHNSMGVIGPGWSVSAVSVSPAALSYTKTGSQVSDPKPYVDWGAMAWKLHNHDENPTFLTTSASVEDEATAWSIIIKDVGSVWQHRRVGIIYPNDHFADQVHIMDDAGLKGDATDGGYAMVSLKALLTRWTSNLPCRWRISSVSPAQSLMR